MFNKKVLAGAIAAASILSVAAPAFASDRMERESEHGMKVRTSSSTPAVTIDVACISSALDKRDSAVGSAFDAQNAAIKTALTARTTALKAAYALTDKTARRTAIRDAWKNWSTAVRAAKSTQKTSRNAAWTTFKTEAKACGAQGVDTTGSSADANL